MIIIDPTFYECINNLFELDFIIKGELCGPLWRIQATTWKDPSHAEFLTSVTQITSAAQAGKLTNNIAGVAVNCPIVNVPV